MILALPERAALLQARSGIRHSTLRSETRSPLLAIICQIDSNKLGRIRLLAPPFEIHVIFILVLALHGDVQLGFVDVPVALRRRVSRQLFGLWKEWTKDAQVPQSLCKVGTSARVHHEM